MTQKSKILNHLAKNKTISQPQASHMYKIKSLSGCITHIRNAGIPIKTVTNSAGNTAYKLSGVAQ